MVTSTHATDVGGQPPSAGTYLPNLIDRHVLRRGLASVALLGVAVVHVLDLQGKLEELAYVGVLFIALIVACLVLTEALTRTDDRRIWLATGAIAALTLLGYAISRTTGLPGDHDEDVGNWLEPLGLTSLCVEGFLVLLVIARLADQRR